jgi:hypothetical protein
MSNTSASKPSFVFGYWRPWEEDSNIYDSYLDYIKDTSLAKYGADTVGLYIKYASSNQVDVINKLHRELTSGLDIISNQLNYVNENLYFINKNLDLLVEQQRISNILLLDISDLLKIPDYEKERQHHIELGLKFFNNAQNNSDLYIDALDEFLKAEVLMKQDYFVLNKIGFIYLYVEKLINPRKALDYFLRAAKYSSAENDKKSIRTFNALIVNNEKSKIKKLESELENFESNFDFAKFPALEKSSYNGWYIEDFTYKLYTVDEDVDDGYDCQESDKIYFKDIINSCDAEENLKVELNKIANSVEDIVKKYGFINNSLNSINSLASDSFEKAAFSAYILGMKEEAIEYQKKALTLYPNSINKFFLAKYLIRNNFHSDGLDYLNQAIDESPFLAMGIFKEIDFINNERVLNLLETKNIEVNNKINQLIDDWASFNSSSVQKINQKLIDLYSKPYDVKVIEYHNIRQEYLSININQDKIERNIDNLILEIKKYFFCTLNIDNLTQELNNLKTLPFEKMQRLFEEFQIAIKNDILKVGSKYGGGIVFFFDEKNKNGLILCEKECKASFWGGKGRINATGNGFGMGLSNTIKIVNNASWYVEKGFFIDSKKPAPTAARLCLELAHQNYNDWYLPSIDELKLVYDFYTKYHKNVKFNNVAYWSSTDCGTEYEHGDIDTLAKLLVSQLGNELAKVLVFNSGRDVNEENREDKDYSQLWANQGDIKDKDRNYIYGVRAIRKFSLESS